MMIGKLFEFVQVKNSQKLLPTPKILSLFFYKTEMDSKRKELTIEMIGIYQVEEVFLNRCYYCCCCRCRRKKHFLSFFFSFDRPNSFWISSIALIVENGPKLNYFRANSDDFEGLENFFRMTLKFPLTFSNKEIMLHKLLCAFVKRASLTKRFFREVHRIFWSHWLPRNVKGVAAILFFVRIL